MSASLRVGDMTGLRPGRPDDPYADETIRQVSARAPAGLAFFLTCVTISSIFEIARFPERARTMLTFAVAFVVLAAVCVVLIQRARAWSIVILIVFVNLIGVALNVYHAIVGAPVAMCLWTLSALLGSTVVILRWGGTNQALASIGTLVSYPIHLVMHTADPLTWAAGLTYLAFLASMSVFGAALYASYVRSGLHLVHALGEREARLQSYFDLAPVGTAVLRADGTISEVNDELCRLLGHTRDEIVGLGWFELAAFEDQAASRAQTKIALRGINEDGGRELRLIRNDGVTMDATVDMRGLPGPRGTIDHVMVLVQDITDRKRMEEERERVLQCELDARRQAEAASRAKDNFLATLSHELRTPLSPILAWSDLLRRHALPRDQTDRGLAAIARNAASQARLIDELLDVSRIVSGKLELERRPLELASVVLEAVDVMRPTADAKGITLETTIACDPCQVMGDPDRLRQVMWNLLANAVKFTPPKGRVQVTLRRSGTDARVVVADTGQGIPASFLPHVFERFRQVDTTSTRRHGGLGIGLAIVHELVELHGGRVLAESPGEGRGATFTVELPVATLAYAPETTRPIRPSGSALAGVRLLVVDDDADSNEVVRMLLASCGADVRTAASAREAMEIAARWLPDVVVSDLAMPEEDGYSLLAAMRAQGQPLGSVPVIALTAYSAPSDREQALSAGFSAHVAKPVRTSDLMGAVLAARSPGTRYH
jgi:PAS domain S-box-containing protein